MKILVAAQQALQLAMGFQDQRPKLQQHESLEHRSIEMLPARSSCSSSDEGIATADAKCVSLRLDEQDKALAELRRSCNNLQDVREIVKDLQQAVMCNFASHLAWQPKQPTSCIPSGSLINDGAPELESRKRGPSMQCIQDDEGAGADCMEPSSPTSSLSMSISSASALTSGFPSQSRSTLTAMECGSKPSLTLSSPSRNSLWHKEKDGEASLKLFGSSSIFKR